MKKKYWEVKYFVRDKHGSRYGTDTFFSNDPEKWIRDMSKSYPNVDFYEYRQLPKPTANNGPFDKSLFEDKI